MIRSSSTKLTHYNAFYCAFVDIGDHVPGFEITATPQVEILFTLSPH